MDTAHQPNEANALRKAHKYQQAIPLYQTLWDGDKKDPWDGWGYAFCLRKTGKLSEALDVCREVYRLSPTLDVNRSLYAWCVYDLEIKTDEVHNPGRFLKAANGITQLTEQKDKYAPYTYTVFKVCKHLLQRNHAEDALEWLDRFDVNHLSDEVSTFKVDGGKERQMPSDLQTYYNLRSKALYKDERYAQCRACVREALEAVPDFVNDGDFWLRRLDALSQAAEGDVAPAYEVLETLLHRKHDWFLQNDLALLAHQLGRKKEAWAHLIQAMLDRAPLELRVNVFDLASAWLEEEGRPEDARPHLELVLAIRQAQGWPVKADLQERADALGCEASVQDPEQLNRGLRKTWQQWRDKMEPRQRGVIEKLLGSGESGFLRAEDGSSYFFRTKSLRGLEAEEGRKVTFRSEPGFDKKKGVATMNAVDIRPDQAHA